MSYIDVIIPAHNAEKFIEAAINSVLSQTFPPKNIIVIDDSSFDSTHNIVKNLQKNNPIIKLYRTKSKIGPSGARNLGIKKSNSEFIAFLDADDIWAFTKLEKQFALFKTSPFKDKLGLVYTNCKDIDLHGNQFSFKNAFSLRLDVRGRVFNKLKNGNLIAGSSSAVLIKRKSLDVLGLFDESLEACEDWDMWIRLSSIYLFDYINEDLVFIRRHPENSQWNINRMISGHLKFYSKHYLLGSISFYRIMGFRAWIFRTYCNVTNIYNLISYASRPKQVIEEIKSNLENIDSWNFDCDKKFKKYFLSPIPFFFLLFYLLLESFYFAIKHKLLKFFK
jgi:glycosyltransferase involved in cell wall biosynthesis